MVEGEVMKNPVMRGTERDKCRQIQEPEVEADKFLGSTYKVINGKIVKVPKIKRKPSSWTR